MWSFDSGHVGMNEKYSGRLMLKLAPRLDQLYLLGVF